MSLIHILRGFEALRLCAAGAYGSRSGYRLRRYALCRAPISLALDTSRDVCRRHRRAHLAVYREAIAAPHVETCRDSSLVKDVPWNVSLWHGAFDNGIIIKGR